MVAIICHLWYNTRMEFERLLEIVGDEPIFETSLLLAYDALKNLAERVPTPDLDMVVTSIVTIRETGANLAEVFDVIAHTVRERKKVEGKIQAMTAEGMTQGVMMCAVPPVLIIAFYFLDPTLVAPLFTTVLGILMLLVIAALDVMGRNEFDRRIIKSLSA